MRGERMRGLRCEWRLQPRYLGTRLASACRPKDTSTRPRIRKLLPTSNSADSTREADGGERGGNTLSEGGWPTSGRVDNFGQGSRKFGASLPALGAASLDRAAASCEARAAPWQLTTTTSRRPRRPTAVTQVLAKGGKSIDMTPNDFEDQRLTKDPVMALEQPFIDPNTLEFPIGKLTDGINKGMDSKTKS